MAVANAVSTHQFVHDAHIQLTHGRDDEQDEKGVADGNDGVGDGAEQFGEGFCAGKESHNARDADQPEHFGVWDT